MRRWGQRAAGVLAAAALWGATACGAAGGAGPKPAAAPNPTAARQIAARDNRLGFALLRQLDAGPTAGNIVVSPPSLAVDLAMLDNGARGTTAAEIAQVLHTRDLGSRRVNADNAALLAALDAPGRGITLALANSLWVNSRVHLVDTFLHTNARYYGAQVAAIDFQSPSGVRRINAWVDAQTGGRIPTLVRHLPATGVLELLQALYFQGTWRTAFNPRDTHPGPFTEADGQSVTLPLMHRTGTFPYAQVSGTQVIALPYGGGRFRMEIALPAGGATLPTDLGQAWAGWQTALRPGRVALTMPRFTLETSQELAGPLAALGMADAFGAAANFSGLCPTGMACQVSDVRQKTELAVDEAGTTAAAATAVGVTTAVATAPQPAVTMTVNRPFLCAIVDQETGAVLFLGQIRVLGA